MWTSCNWISLESRLRSSSCMSVVTNSADWPKAVLAVFGYGLMFWRTIRHNRDNRPVVLGVWTVIMFGGFMVLAALSGRPLLQTVFAIARILLGILLLFFVAQDVVRWLRGKERSKS